MLIPKSHKIRHEVLKVLSDKRKSMDMKTFRDDAAMTLTEIVIAVKRDRKDVDEQLDVLYHSKDIDAIKRKEGENSFFISEKGFATAAANTILNDGKVVNSQLYNNYASAAFQILTGLTALATIIFSFATVTDLQNENSELKKELEKMGRLLQEVNVEIHKPDSIR